MQTETPQQKTMQDIFALDEAVSQFESFGSQLDLGLPTEEDDAPKSFDDMLEVNPSDEPLEYGENFASEGNDLADKQTQKFVVDEFAKEAAKLPDGNITAADITGISAIIQMNNHIVGDVHSFIDQTISHAIQAQQQQNVSDAQPNGTVAQDIAKTGDAGAEDVGMDEAGIPPMDAIEPTAEPTLDVNPDDGLGVDPALDTNVGDPLADMNGIGDDLAGVGDLGTDEPAVDAPIADTDVPVDSAPAEGGDLGAGMDSIDASLDAEAGAEPEGAPDAAATSEGDDLANFLDSDEGEENKDADASPTATDDKGSNDSAPSESKDDKDSADDGEKKDGDDGDDDFNFEAIATKARGLVEGSEATVPEDPKATEDGKEKGAAEAEKDCAVEGVEDGSAPVVDEPAATDDTTSDDTGDDLLSECDFTEKAAKVESIVTKTKMKLAAERAHAVLESYHKAIDKANTMAKLESVMENLKKNTKAAAIVDNFAKESQKRAALEAAATAMVDTKPVEPSTPTVEKKTVFESTINKIDTAIANKKSVSEEADKVIAEFEAQHKATAAATPVVESANPATAKDTLASQLNSLLEGIQKSKDVANFDKKLNDLVNLVKNS